MDAVLGTAVHDDGVVGAVGHCEVVLIWIVWIEGVEWFSVEMHAMNRYKC